MERSPSLNRKRINALAAFARTTAIAPPMKFSSGTERPGAEYIFNDMYPPLEAPGTIDLFFFVMIHNYGFWLDDGTRYTSPLFGKWNGKSGVKGSDLLWKMLYSALRKDAECFSPPRLATISATGFATIFSDDDGPVPFFNTEQRIALTRDYGRWFRTRRMAGQSPDELVQYASEYSDPVGALREILTHPENGIPGYREDPLGKKAELLLMALMNRPDRLLRKDERTACRPIVDYHDMRLTLRMGHIILPKAWRDENSQRLITSPEREAAIRLATYRADVHLIERSGRTRDEIDALKWSARSFCPEMTAPKCDACALKKVCAQNTQLFQPVVRTTFY